MGNARVSRSAGFRFTLGIMLGVAFSVLPISAEERRSDSRSLSDLFGDTLSENALEVCRRARQQPLESRFQTLFGHVFPPETENLRISIDFLPTNPSPPVAEKYGSAKSPLLATEAQNRLPSGGSLVSPALELVETARRLGKLEELREEIIRRSPTGNEQIKARDAMLLLVVAATANFEQYGIQLNEFMTLVRESPITDPVRATEVVVVWHGVSQEQTRTEIRDLLLLLREQMKLDGNSHRERVKRHIFTLNHLLDEQFVQSGSTLPKQKSGESRDYWHPVSRRTARTRGEGFPDPAWSVTPTRARHISSHDHDYLYFAAPLRGNYEIEGDLTTFGYREIRLAVGTIWAGPLYDHERMSWGNFRRELPHLKLDKRFSNFGEHMHVRVVVRDGQRTTSINGRDVFTSAQGPNNDPWVSAHSPWLSSGEMRNVRITGNPEIPEELDLIANPELPGWLQYFDESAGQSGSNWSVSEQRPSTLLERLNPFADRAAPILIGRTSNAPRGTSQESLLRYHRPMLEDGTIEYEFYYKSSELEVFPAVDRLAIVFDADRTGIHWITDGKYDTTGVDPANFHPVSNDRPIPLMPDAWNRIQLSLKGDDLEVALNGKSIFTRKLEPENLRTFGLFHYSDRTTAMIRNLRWRGEWPRELPPVKRQELADLTLEQTLDRGPELPVVFEHDFSRGLPLEKIWISGKDWQQHVKPDGKGLEMTRSGGGYEKFSFSLPFPVEGDFDAVWEFEDFQSSVAEGGNGNLQLLILLDDQNATECRIYRKYGHPNKDKHEQFVQPAIFYTKPDGKTHYGFPLNVAEESTSGKLRIVRRGTTMYFLYAEGDSENFRLVYETTVSDARVKFGGIKGIIETHQAGETTARWKRVVLRAETSPEILNSPGVTLAELDEQRSDMSEVFSCVFNRQTDPGQLVIWGEQSHIAQDQTGWLIREPGADSWRATGISPQVDLRGDFDVTLELEVLRLDSTKQGAESTVFLHAGFNTDRPHAVEIKFSQTASEQRDIEIQMNSSGRDNGVRYDELKHQQLDNVTQFRIARRGPIAYLIYRGERDAQPQIYGRIDVGEAEITRNSLRTMVHTGDKSRETIVKFKSMTIHTEQVMSPDTSP